MNERTLKTDRVIGHVRGSATGPLLMLVGGIHGNETAGVQATERVFKQLNHEALRGELVGLKGNLPALAARRRFIDYDMNRCWTPDHIARLQAEGPSQTSEDQEVIDLLAWIDHYSAQSHSARVLADLHTTSAQRGSFVIAPEQYARHPVVEVLSIPIVSRIENFLPGTLMVHAVQQGFVSFSFEGGQIGSIEAIDLHEAGIWMILHTMKMVELSAQQIEQHRRLLHQYGHALPKRVAALSMHVIAEGAAFVMNPGYYNFKPVQRGEVVARDNNGPIASPQEGMIFMPLYQKEGNDGFFIVQEEE